MSSDPTNAIISARRNLSRMTRGAAGGLSETPSPPAPVKTFQDIIVPKTLVETESGLEGQTIQSSTSLGANAYQKESGDFSNANVVIGDDAATDMGTSSSAFANTVVGSGAAQTLDQGSDNVLIGTGTDVGSGGADGNVGVGANVFIDANGGVSIGNNSFVQADGGVAVGEGAQANGENAVAIGRGADASFDDSICIGNGTAPTSAGEVHIGFFQPKGVTSGEWHFRVNGTEYKVAVTVV